ncbi:MAG: DNA-binding response regulator, partial [Aestuariivirgaceae bacterium]
MISWQSSGWGHKKNEGFPVIILVDERPLVTDAYESGFAREGISSIGFEPPEFEDWVATAPEPDLMAVEAFVIGNCDRQASYPKIIRGRSPAPVLAMNENEGLEQTLKLFEAGVDDVVR